MESHNELVVNTFNPDLYEVHNNKTLTVIAYIIGCYLTN